MKEIILEQNDLIRLKSKEDVEFVSENNNTITGINNSGEIVKFRHDEIDCIKKAGITSCGGDDNNYWLFYTGSGYATTDIAIANWARFEIPQLFEQFTIEEIIKRHLFWATESSQYEAMYNGDTYVLYYNINALPEDIKIDAENAR